MGRRMFSKSVFYVIWYVSIKPNNRIVFTENDFDGDFDGITLPFDWWEEDDFDDFDPPPSLPPGW
jgi:hypothetical protein